MAALQYNLFAPAAGRFAPPAVPDEPYRDPFLATHAATLDAAGDDPLAFDEAEWFDGPTGAAVGLDVEVYRDFFVACLLRFRDGKRLAFERSARADLDASALGRVLASNLIVTFNGATYDLPILALALAGRTCSELKDASDRIIRSNVRSWQVYEELGVAPLRLDHVDLFEVNPSVKMGLKLLAGRLHQRFLVDLPYDPDARLSPREMNVTTLYCFNDLDATGALYAANREPLLLRVGLGKRYRLDLRSRSDSQVGEAIVKKRVEALTRRRLQKSDVVRTTAFGYDVPSFVRFESDHLQRIVDELRTAVFGVTPAGDLDPPAFLRDLKVPLGTGVYSMGSGGLHSTEANRAVEANEDLALIDVDVASQYPSIIRNLGLFPPAVGPDFLTIYGEMIDERLAAKAAGDRVAADGLKISINGVYGKLGSPYSVLYAPKLLIATTLTGQLAILMLIEAAERAGIPVVSANTDGVVFLCPRAEEQTLSQVIATWESATGFVTEATRYRGLYASSVNSYVAIKEDGRAKVKGPLANPWAEGDLRSMQQKNPQMTILSEAIVAYLRDRTPLAETIEACDDPKKLVALTRVSTGGYWRGAYLGRVVRYYWSVTGEPILTGGGSKVSRTDGARPLGELPDRAPRDVDRARYLQEATSLLMDLGVRL